MLKLYTSEFIRIVLNAHQIFTLNTDFNKLLTYKAVKPRVQVKSPISSSAIVVTIKFYLDV